MKAATMSPWPELEVLEATVVLLELTTMVVTCCVEIIYSVVAKVNPIIPACHTKQVLCTVYLVTTRPPMSGPEEQFTDLRSRAAHCSLPIIRDNKRLASSESRDFLGHTDGLACAHTQDHIRYHAI